MPLLVRQDDLLLRFVKDLNDIRSALRRVVANVPLFDISNENTPAQITSDQNDYVPGNFDVLRLSTDAPRTITGFRGGVKGRFLRLFNVGTYEITIAQQNALSAVGNRVVSPTGFDIVLNAGGELVLYYDIIRGVWISSYATNADRISCELRLTAPQTVPDLTYTDIIWTSVVRDTGNFFDPSAPNAITIPETGWYDVGCTVVWAASDGTRFTLLRSLPSSSFLSLLDVRSAAPPTWSTVITMGRTCYLPIGSQIVLRVQQEQNISGPLDVEVNGPGALGTCLIVSKV
jgi:hypothetical protein